MASSWDLDVGPSPDTKERFAERIKRSLLLCQVFFSAIINSREVRAGMADSIALSRNVAKLPRYEGHQRGGGQDNRPAPEGDMASACDPSRSLSLACVGFVKSVIVQKTQAANME